MERMDHSCAADSFRWRWLMVYDWIHSLALHLSNALRSAASIKNTRGRHSRVLALNDISVVFWHALLPEDEPIAMYSPRGEEKAGYMWQMKRAMYGTRRASRPLPRTHERSSQRSKICSTQGMSPSLYCLETDSMAAVHGDDIIRGRRTREIGSSG